MANDESNSVLNVDAAGERKMLEGRKEGEKSKVGPMAGSRNLVRFVPVLLLCV